jgi:Fe-Mn family superoxide dismutase
MRYQLKQIYCRPYLLDGLSLKLIESHYENNYGGALRRLNAITEQLEKLDFATAPGYLVNGLKREELAALNSTTLHELYFASLGGDGNPTPVLAEALTRDFGSVERWRAQFMAMGHALGGGSGWVLLVYLPGHRRLINQYASEHSLAVAGGIPILALDMYEHAYHIDFGANAKAYVDAFMRNTDWSAVNGRYEAARQVAPLPPPPVQPEFADVPGVEVEQVQSMLAADGKVQFIDVRPKHFVARTQDIANGATWRDPERIGEWIGELSKDVPVVVFCVYGFHVGCGATLTLRDAGFDASYMKGGHSGWKAAGGPTKTFALPHPVTP